MPRHEAWQGAGELPFDPQPPPAVAYEPKTCEMCPRTFFREVGTHAKYCSACLNKSTMARESQGDNASHRYQAHWLRERVQRIH